MLPFLAKKSQGSVAGLIMKTRTPDTTPETPEVDDSSAAIEACAQELIRAIHAKDAKAVAAALQDAMDLCSESDDSQNIKAAAEEKE